MTRTLVTNRQCPACGASFTSLRVIQHHIKGSDGLIYIGIKCKACKTSFSVTKDNTPFSHTEDICCLPSGRDLQNHIAIHRRIIQREQAILNRYIPLSGKALDVGFGDATDMGLTAEQGWNVYGIELSPTAVAIAHRGDIKCARAVSNYLPFKGDSFDFVRLRSVIEHLPEPELALREIKRVLRPGGVVSISFPTEGWADTVQQRFRSVIVKNPAIIAWRNRKKEPALDAEITWLEPPEHVLWLSQKGLKALLLRVGLHPLLIRTTYRGDPAHFPWGRATHYELHKGAKFNWKGKLELGLVDLMDRSSALFSRGSWLYGYAMKPTSDEALISDNIVK